VIEELRKEKLEVQEARKSGREVPDSEVDLAYATMAGRMRLTPEQLTQQLARSGTSTLTRSSTAFVPILPRGGGLGSELPSIASSYHQMNTAGETLNRLPSARACRALISRLPFRPR